MQRPPDTRRHAILEAVGFAAERPGVPSALRDTVFGAFERGPSTPSHAPGSGVGLTLVARFAELHGGRARVEEREGGGASFKVLLPG